MMNKSILQEDYQLYFADFKIGTVTNVTSDFPHLWGVVNYAAWLATPSTPEEIRLAEFLELSRRSTHFGDLESEQDVNQDIEKIDQQLNTFQDFIETDAWYLIDRNGAKNMILCPIFRDEGEIVWRWNPDIS